LLNGANRDRTGDLLLANRIRVTFAGRRDRRAYARFTALRPVGGGARIHFDSPRFGWVTGNRYRLAEAGRR